ncbi:replicative DNA helicase [Parabacteroides sp. Marseille-P3160]|uniref:replicative DNA helicase n=1 Tax=Parabacteroides sp. Marseille-P3160 TaxID=1917887 RepID=UPI0009BB48F4|nr:replicative DNA helicase [Parabacteroides sp. Marseille-P3160]
MKQNKNIISFGLLPNNKEAEEAVIGALLVESTAINEVSDILVPDAFYHQSYSAIYQAILNVSNSGNIPDMVTVAQELIRTGKLNEAGGPAVLSVLAGEIASSANIREYAMIVHQCWLSRRLIVSAKTIEAKAADPQFDISDTIDEALREVESIADGTCYASLSKSIGEAGKTALDLYGKRKMMAKDGIKSGIGTGIYDLDVIINGGWKLGQLVILAARPAMGKTAMMLHLTKAAAKSNIPMMVFSLEMDAQGLINRLLMSECNIDSYRFASGKLTADEEVYLSNAYDRLCGLPITIDDTPGISIQQIKSRARNAQIKGKCGMILIDYLQLIDMRTQNKTYNREQEVSQTSRAAKIMAKELGVPVILLSQLSRQVENRTDKVPMLSDLRESGAIEQDADIVCFIHRPEYYDKNSEKGVGILRIAKQRDGATGDVAFRYNSNLTKISGFENNEKLPF